MRPAHEVPQAFLARLGVLSLASGEVKLFELEAGRVAPWDSILLGFRHQGLVYFLDGAIPSILNVNDFIDHVCQFVLVLLGLR